MTLHPRYAEAEDARDDEIHNGPAFGCGRRVGMWRTMVADRNDAPFSRALPGSSAVRSRSASWVRQVRLFRAELVRLARQDGQRARHALPRAVLDILPDDGAV